MFLKYLSLEAWCRPLVFLAQIMFFQVAMRRKAE